MAGTYGLKVSSRTPTKSSIEADSSSTGAEGTSHWATGASREATGEEGKEVDPDIVRIINIFFNGAFKIFEFSIFLLPKGNKKIEAKNHFK